MVFYFVSLHFSRFFNNGHVLIQSLKRVYNIYCSKLAAYSDNDYRLVIDYYQWESVKREDIEYHSVLVITEKEMKIKYVGDPQNYSNYSRIWSGWLFSLHWSLSFGWKSQCTWHDFIIWNLVSSASCLNHTAISVCFSSYTLLWSSLINSENQGRAEVPSVDFRFKETWLPVPIFPLISSVILNLFSYFLESQFLHLQNGSMGYNSQGCCEVKYMMLVKRLAKHLAYNKCWINSGCQCP